MGTGKKEWVCGGRRVFSLSNFKLNSINHITFTINNFFKVNHLQPPMEFLITQNIEAPHGPTTPSLCIYLRGMKTYPLVQ